MQQILAEKPEFALLAGNTYNFFQKKNILNAFMFLQVCVF